MSSFGPRFLESQSISPPLLGAVRQIGEYRGRKETYAADIARASPGVSRPTIQHATRRLRDDGLIEVLQSGRDARWRKRRGGS